MEIKASDLSARLLATENLSVVRARTRTASFDIKSRVLTLPMWKDMTPEIEDMLIGHEVGHALYTGDEYTKPIEENRKMQGYLNVLEDVRIEKLIKRKYPGLRKRMNEGYKQLNDRDFFGVKQTQSLDSLLLIDKINLYFKAGFSCGVNFTPEEKLFVIRAEKTETIEDVIALAHEVYAYSKKEMEQRKQAAKEEGDSFEEDDEDGIDADFDLDLDQDFDEEESEDADELKELLRNTSKQNDQRTEEYDEEQLQSKTERAFADKLNDLADDSTEYHYWKFDDEYMNPVVVPFKTILSETNSPEQWLNSEEAAPRYRYYSEQELAEMGGAQRKEFDQFKIDSSRAVNYLVKEFEMRKSAQMYKRAQISKIGSLDMKKVYAYKLKDDIFKRVTNLPQGKNHGMIMLVDWSGSMNEVLQDTLKQVINLAMFCNRIQIPYRVYAFTTEYAGAFTENASKDEQSSIARRIYEREFSSKKMEKFANDRVLSNASHPFNLLELFSNKMSTSEFNSMSRRLLDYRFQWNRGYATSGTPLNEALVWCYNNIGTFVKNNNIEKMTFITLTDGEGHALSSVGHHRGLDDTRTEIIGSEYKRIKQKHFIRDNVTQKTYEINRYGPCQTETILRMIKDRYDISVLGFHICQNHRRDLNSVIHANLPSFNGSTYNLIEEWRKNFRANGFASIKNTGRDDLFLIPQASTKIQEGELDVKADANAKSIARNFGKYLNTKKTSRVLLNNFIGYVA
jgi:hypothetical protein